MKVAFVGKREVTTEEANLIETIAAVLALLGHHVITTRAEGVNAHVRKGVGDEGVQAEVRESGALAGADQAIIYADEELIASLTQAKALPDPRVALLTTRDQLEAFCDYAVIAGYKRNVI